MGVSAGFVTQRVRDLTRLDHELPWVEFKRNTFDPVKIGEYISALANSAAIADQPYSFLIWGVDDDTRVPVGTTVNPWTAKVGNEEVIPWLRRGVSPATADFEFHEIELEGHRLVALVVERADASPVRFKRIPHIRDGSYTMELAERPLLERELFRSFDRTPFEARVAKDNCTAEQIASLLNLDTYVALTGNAGSSNTADLLSHLESDKLIRRVTADRWDILNCGALCLARRLDLFQGLKRKAVRFVQYEDETRARAIDTADGNKGYAEGFEGLLKHISGRLPRREVTDTHRRMVEDFPQIAVRELIANALVHQDFTAVGAGPLIELFRDRLEISNPGVPLHADTRRLLDSPPKSRNEALAGFLRKCRICEERGSGIDKAALAAEEAHLPAPEVRAVESSTIARLLGPRPLASMEREDRLWATYLHTSLRYVNQQDVTNATLRERFGIDPRNSATASRLLRDAQDHELIRPRDPSAGPGQMRYVPFWA